jgi:E3 ubiquitin-protein ligase ZNF598
VLPMANKTFTLMNPLCGSTKCRSVQGLKDHLKDRHDQHLCEVCLEHKKAFLGEQARYTRAALDVHTAKGDPGRGFFGHPQCKFCKRRLYDADQLYDHLMKQHFACDICEGRGIRHNFYRNYGDLQRHFRAEHFLCEDPRCLEQKFVVFADQVSFQAHVIASHPEQGVSRRVAVNFRIRGQRGAGEGAEEGPTGEPQGDEGDEVRCWG